jgi:hypothetical protein
MALRFKENARSLDDVADPYETIVAWSALANCVNRCSMDAKLLTENAWKTVAQKSKIKDCGLQRALSAYESVDEDKPAEKLKVLAVVVQVVGTQKKAKDAAAVPDAVKYLTNVLAVAQVQQRELAQTKVAADKTQAVAAQKAAAESQGEEEEEESLDTLEAVKRSLITLKTSKLPYYFIACDAKPYGLIVSKKDIRKSTPMKRELARLAGGTTRAPRVGTCRRENNRLIFEMEKPPSGLARILQKWIKSSIGLGLNVMVGDESAEDQEQESIGGTKDTATTLKEKSAANRTEQSNSVPHTGQTESIAVPQKTSNAASATKRAFAARNEQKVEELEDRRREFKKARAAWVAVKVKAEQDLEKVKDGLRMAYLADAEQYPKVVEGCKEIDAILDSLDDELRDTLDQYASTSIRNQSKLSELAETADEVLDRYQKYVASNALMKAIDMKEFADVTVHAPVMKALSTLRKALA